MPAPCQVHRTGTNCASRPSSGKGMHLPHCILYHWVDIRLEGLITSNLDDLELILDYYRWEKLQLVSQ